MFDEEMSDEKCCEKIIDLVNNHAISTDSIYKLVEVSAHLTDNGVFNLDVLLKSIVHNDVDCNTPYDELCERIKNSNELIRLAKFWNQQLYREFGSRQSS